MKDTPNAKRTHSHFKWLVVFGSFVVYFIADGVSLSFGIFTREFIAYFKQSDTQSHVFLTNGLIQAVPLFLSPLVCVLIRKLGCRVVTLAGSSCLAVSFVLVRYLVRDLVSLNLVIGVMASCGLAMIYIPAYLIISFYFDRRRAFATGLAVSGSGLGLFVMSPLSELLIKHYGWMDTCFLFGAISAHTFISACLFRAPAKTAAQEKTQAADAAAAAAATAAAASQLDADYEEHRAAVKRNRSKKNSLRYHLNELKDIYRSRKFILVNLSYFFLSLVIIAPYNFLPSHIQLHKIDDPSSWSISLIGISTLFGQITIGYISDMYRSYNWLIYAIALIVAGCLTIILPFFRSVAWIYIYSIGFGFSTSVNYVLQSSLVIESIGLKNLTLAFGCVQLAQSFSTLFGTPFLGWVRDNGQNYDLSFQISGAVMILSALIMILWPFFSSKK